MLILEVKLQTEGADITHLQILLKTSIFLKYVADEGLTSMKYSSPWRKCTSSL
jgi:hypothetical protein